MNSQPMIKLAIALTLVIQSVVSIPSVEATCRTTGRIIGGRPELKCTPEGKSCCRNTGRTKRVKGRIYQIMDCSRCPR